MEPLKQSFETWKRKYFCQGGEWYSHSKNNIDTVYSSSAAYVANSAFYIVVWHSPFTQT